MERKKPTNGINNLIPFHELPEERQREIRRKGLEASTKVRRQKKQVKDLLNALLSSKAPDGLKTVLKKHFPDVEMKTLEDVCNLSIIKEIIKGNVQAYNAIYDRAEGKPNQGIVMDSSVTVNDGLSEEKKAEIRQALITQGLIKDDEFSRDSEQKRS
jgi:hypothetical protein